MVIYVKFNSEEKPVEFTTAQEAKQHLADQFSKEGEDKVNSVFVSVLAEPVDDGEDLAFDEFTELEKANEFVDKQVEALSAAEKDENSDDSSGDSENTSDDDGSKEESETA